jgi:L-fucose mutarotase
MLLHTLVHPEITAVLAAAGHHAKVLIADGNYPASSKKGPNAKVVSLNLMPGVVSCTQALQALLAAAPWEAANTMMYERTGQYALSQDPAVWADYRAALAAAKSPLALEPIEKWAFYDAVATPDHVLTIQTADQSPFGNLLLTMGCRVR